MKLVDKNKMLNKLAERGVAGAMEWDSLHYLIDEEAPVTCYETDAFLVFLNPDKDVEHVTVIPTKETFDVDALLTWIRAHTTHANVLINVTKLNPSFHQTVLTQAEACAKHYGTLHDYAYFAQGEKKGDAQVRMLEEHDRDAFLKVSDEVIRYRPPLSMLFELFVLRKQGTILGFFDGEKILGYLSYIRVNDAVYDVDYLYVRPDAREQGIADKLLTSYIAVAQTDGVIAYCGNAKSEASARTAQSCGMELVRVVERFYNA